MKKQFYIVVVVLILGMWLGINFAKNQPFFSNPFADKTLAEKAKRTAKNVAREAQEAVSLVLQEDSK